MSAFSARPNNTCTYYEKKDGFNLYGEPEGFKVGRVVPCAVISYDLKRSKTSVRADTSGTRGSAENLEGIARFLFPSKLMLNRGDIIYKDDYWLEIREIHKRYDVLGNFDHYEVDMTKTEPPDGLQT